VGRGRRPAFFVDPGACRAGPWRSAIEARKRAEEQEQRESEAAAARKRDLDGLVGCEARLWSEVEALVGTSKAAGYEEAVRLLVDLRDLGRRRSGGDFAQRIAALRKANGRRSAFISRLDHAGL